MPKISHRIYFVKSGVVFKEALDYGGVTVLSSYMEGTVTVLPYAD